MNESPRRLYSAAQVRELDRRAIEEFGIPGYVLMQRAAAACFREWRTRWPSARRIHVVCGPGNNGGDGYEIAHLAKSAGLAVSLWQVGGVPRAGDAVIAHTGWIDEGGHHAAYEPGCLEGAELIVDAIFGIGIARPVSGEPAAAIAAINARPVDVPVIAVDLPSGLDADRGQPQGIAVRADLTVSFIGAKLGLHTAAGPDHAGERLLDTLQLPDELLAGGAALADLLSAEDLRGWLPRRPRDSHKGRHGHVLLIGGDHGTSGAILLAARAALRSGAGLVTVATRAAHAALLTAAQPDAMFRAVESADDLAVLIAQADVVAIGPGLGQQEWGRSMWASAIDGGKPMVVDADALNLLAAQPSRGLWVLTPHPGEAARLLGCSNAEIQADRVAAVHALQQRYGGVVVLKGAGSLIQGNALALCPYGNPGMGTGGMGDVLTGIIAAMLGQGLPLEAAARAGVLVHALAGDRAAAAGERGLAPGDLVDALRAMVNP